MAMRNTNMTNIIIMLKSLHARAAVCTKEYTYIHPPQALWCTPFENGVARVKSISRGARADMSHDAGRADGGRGAKPVKWIHHFVSRRQVRFNLTDACVAT